MMVIIMMVGNHNDGNHNDGNHNDVVETSS